MRVGEFACMGDASARSAWLDVEYMRTVAYDYARLRVRGGGGGEGSFVCQFACCVFAIVGVSAVCACAWSRGWSFACLLRLRDSWVRWYLRYLRMCMFAVR